MARGKAEFSTMQPMSVKLKSDTPEVSKPNADLNLDETMNVKAFSNANFQSAMGNEARRRAVKWNSKPQYPVMPIQARQGFPGNPGGQAIATPGDKPFGGRKPIEKGIGKDVAIAAGVSAPVGLATAHTANLLQDKREIRREQGLPPKKGFLKKLLKKDE